MDQSIKIVSVKDSVGFDPTTLQPSRHKVVTYTVGMHGPFNLTFTPEEYTAAAVERKIMENVAVLRGIGALPPA